MRTHLRPRASATARDGEQRYRSAEGVGSTGTRSRRGKDAPSVGKRQDERGELGRGCSAADAVARISRGTWRTGTGREQLDGKARDGNERTGPRADSALRHSQPSSLRAAGNGERGAGEGDG